MTSFAKRFNTPTANFDFEMPENHEYIDLRSLASQRGLDEAYVVRMLYINKKGKFGDNPVVVTDDHLVNLPSHLLETVKDILTDAPSISMINNGEVGFKIYQYNNQFGDQYSIEWIDIPPTK